MGVHGWLCAAAQALDNKDAEEFTLQFSF